MDVIRKAMERARSQNSGDARRVAPRDTRPVLHAVPDPSRPRARAPNEQSKAPKGSGRLDRPPGAVPAPGVSRPAPAHAAIPAKATNLAPPPAGQSATRGQAIEQAAAEARRESPASPEAFKSAPPVRKASPLQHATRFTVAVLTMMLCLYSVLATVKYLTEPARVAQPDRFAAPETARVEPATETEPLRRLPGEVPTGDSERSTGAGSAERDTPGGSDAEHRDPAAEIQPEIAEPHRPLEPGSGMVEVPFGASPYAGARPGERWRRHPDARSLLPGSLYGLGRPLADASRASRDPIAAERMDPALDSGAPTDLADVQSPDAAQPTGPGSSTDANPAGATDPANKSPVPPHEPGTATETPRQDAQTASGDRGATGAVQPDPGPGPSGNTASGADPAGPHSGATPGSVTAQEPAPPADNNNNAAGNDLGSAGGPTIGIPGTPSGTAPGTTTQPGTVAGPSSPPSAGGENPGSSGPPSGSGPLADQNQGTAPGAAAEPPPVPPVSTAPPAPIPPGTGSGQPPPAPQPSPWKPGDLQPNWPDWLQPAAPAPLARTESALSITTSVSGVLLMPGPDSQIFSDSTTETLALSLGSISGLSSHITAADAEVEIQPGSSLESGGLLLDTTPIATMNLAHRTHAESLWNGPLAAYARAESRVGFSDLLVVPLLPNAALELSWDIDRFDFETRPSSSLAITQHLARVTQAPLNGDSGTAIHSVVGFTVLSQDGASVITTYDVAGSTTLRDWLLGALNPSQAGGSGSGPRVAIPLTQAFLDPATGLPTVELSLEVTHLEYSVEAPLAAVQRVGEQAGSLHSGAFAHWDAANQTLSFEPLAIDLMSNGAEAIIAGKYLHDPLAGGHIEIDPLVYAGALGDNGYFVGNQIRLVAGDGTVLFWASLPGMIFDDRLFDEEGFNLFAPLLNIGSGRDTESAWLDRFWARFAAEELLLPELFVGLDLGSGDSSAWWENDFSVQSRAVLSFAGLLSGEALPILVPIPATWLVLALGLLMFGLIQIHSHARHRGGR